MIFAKTVASRYINDLLICDVWVWLAVVGYHHVDVKIEMVNLDANGFHQGAGYD